MLSKAHMTVGMAAAMSVMMPDTASEFFPVVFGAAAGCVICDIDCESSEKLDASKGRLLAVLIAASALLADYLLDGGMCSSAASHGYWWFAGVAGFLITCAFASVSSHRGFSHSILALILETGSLWLVFTAAAEPFAIAFISHILLDIFNFRSVRLFYPLKNGISLKLFHVNGIANRVCAITGAVWLAAVICLCIRSGQIV
jgi:inner membrane protein